MKKYIPLGMALILIFVLYGLFSSYQNENIKQNIASVKTQEELVFSNKQKCAAYLDDINKKIATSNEAASGSSFNFNFTLEELWFSKSANSCLYTVKGEVRNEEGNKVFTNYLIWDYLTGKEIPYLGRESDYPEERKKLD